MRIGSISERLFIIVLITHGLLLIWSSYVNSPTIDEIEWLPAGVIYLTTGQLDIAVTRNPPHVGLIAALPLLFTDMDTTTLQSQGRVRDLLDEFFLRNGERTFWFFTLARWACIPFSIIGAITCYFWAKDLYGRRPGLLAAVLWCFCPNILAHGQLVSHDVPSTSLLFAATYLFWRWLRHSSVNNALVAGIGLGVALCSKMTVLICLVLWPLMWIGSSFGNQGNKRAGRWLLIDGVKLAAILFVAVDVLNLGYGFNGTFNRLDSYEFRSQALGGTVAEPANLFIGTTLGKLPVPLPSAYVTGLDLQRVGLEGGWPVQHSYLRETWSQRGWWYYYLYALAIKVPLGTWCLAMLSGVYRITSQKDARLVRDEILVLTPAFAILVIASSSTMTDHLRYVLPCFPFLFIWISRVANVRWHANRLMVVLASVATGWTVASSLAQYPHSLSYFNELVGGPRNGHAHLVSSNIDYGQDLIYLKEWYDQHPQARPLGISYNFFWPVDPRVAGIEYFVAPSGPDPTARGAQLASTKLGPRPGWYAVNVNALRADEWPGRLTYKDLSFYGYFLNFEPVNLVGYSIYIYHLEIDEVNEVRLRMGLPPLDSE